MDEIKTFDLIGFKGDGIVSSVISHCQKHALKKEYQGIEPKITHVGIAIRGEDLLNVPDDILSSLKGQIDASKVYLFESQLIRSATDNVPDVFGANRSGVKLRSLDDILQVFNGDIYYSSHIFITSDESLNQFVRYIVEKNYTKYEKHFYILVANVFRCCTVRRQSKSMFCSELVARSLMEIKVLSGDVNAEYVVPLDFYINPANPTETYDIDKEIPILFKFPIKLDKVKKEVPAE